MQSIPKLTLAAAVAAGISAGANAVAVHGNVSEMQLFIVNEDILAPASASFSGMTIGGDTVTGLTLTGDMIGYSTAAYIGLSWNLTDGMRQGVNGAGGTSFQGGTIEVSASTDGGTSWFYIETIDASVTAVDFLAGQPGHFVADPAVQTTAGLVVDDAGYGTLPGLWDLIIFSDGWDSAAGQLYMFDQTWGIFMEGSVAPVPVPAAAWLFGSALLGLAGMRRRPKAA